MEKKRMEETLEDKSEKIQPKAFLKEIILENFMSYEYARIPFEAGLNLICGPNGSGKSSILLALSVGLGQAYTERSKKLSGLIRRGEELARITLLFDNSPVNGKRPISGYNSDTFMLSRYLRRDGTYWYEAEYREVPKAEVVKILSSLGINPDNMLIIMHQNMVEEFSVIPPNQKLVMLEEAVGFQNYRKRIVEAQERLSQVLSEESSVLSLLSNAEQTLQYWREQYGKYLKRRELNEKKNYLKRELAWAYVTKTEKNLNSLNQELKKKNLSLENLARELKEIGKELDEASKALERLSSERRKLFSSLLEGEKEVGGFEAYLKVFDETSKKIDFLLGLARENMGKGREKEEYGKVFEWFLRFREEAKTLNEKLKEAKRKIENLRSNFSMVEEKIVSLQEKYVGWRVKEAVLSFQKEYLEREVGELKDKIKRFEEELNQQTLEAKKTGVRVETTRSIQEISEDLKVLGVQLASLADVSEDAEKMYRRYLKIFEELKQKSEVVAENKRKMLAEIEVRKQTWRRILEDFLGELNKTYKSTLSAVDATGEVRLINMENIGDAGLELTVGFHGLPPTTLDAYTQSGGERSTATMAFLLSLQKHVKSPIRAVDEFDVHMDPRNRELVSRLIISTVKSQPNIQYIVITPSQLPFLDVETNVIVVQNVAGKSKVKTVAV
ncbi:MAG: hypothetical protein DRO36_04270 [Candidatus Hecatellales archaeon]|nr:MAG: hypothetical protein DRO36_04270 [Candidatus Hecatellales archaeon]